jgi:hypothetical protein
MPSANLSLNSSKTDNNNISTTRPNEPDDRPNPATANFVVNGGNFAACALLPRDVTLAGNFLVHSYAASQLAPHNRWAFHSTAVAPSTCAATPRHRCFRCARVRQNVVEVNGAHQTPASEHSLIQTILKYP